jgi:lysocardiolipin and lysophospholipid acyltransferase
MKGIVFMILMTAGAFAAIVMTIPMMMLILVHSKRVIGWRRKYVSYISGLYFDYAAALIYYLGGTKIYIYSKCDTEILKKDKNALIICNHPSRVDWMFAGWSYGAYLRLNANLRIILKESLRSIPVYGWAMQIMMYIFLSRKRDQDVPYIIRSLSYLLCTGPVPSIFLYPEGTDLSEGNKKKSNACKYSCIYLYKYI